MNEDEFIEVKLLKSEAQILKILIKEREAYNLFVNKLKGTYVFFIATGILALWALWDKIHAILISGVK